MESKKYLDYDGLTDYHTKMTKYVDDKTVGKQGFDIEIKENTLFFSRLGLEESTDKI